MDRQQSPTFTGIISKDTRREDKYFAQFRLAGYCPYAKFCKAKVK